MNYPDSVRYLYQLGNELKSAKFDLGRIGVLLEALGSPQRGMRFVHVAGTNGKGSVCAMVESGLRASGLKTGLYTSPHLLEPTERIRIAGVPVTAQQFTAAFVRVHEVAERLIEAGEFELHPSYFETVTAMGFLLFRKAATHVTVLEVGLGGRLDATNVVAPEICVITPVEFDHEALLGRNLTAIATEKAGILKSGVPVVMAPQRAEAEAVIRSRAAELGCTLIAAADWCVSGLRMYALGSRMRIERRRPHEIVCPLPGRHQIQNVQTALAVLDTLGVPAAAVADGIAGVRWPGRLEHLGDFVLDGAHNPAGARALAEYVKEFYSGRTKTLIFGAMRDKAVEEMTAVLFPLFDRVIVTAPEQGRALEPGSYRRFVEHPSLCEAASLREALAMAGGGVVFVSGSLFLVAEAELALRSEP